MAVDISRRSEAEDVSCTTRRGESGYTHFSPEAQREQLPGPCFQPPSRPRAPAQLIRIGCCLMAFQSKPSGKRRAPQAEKVRSPQYGCQGARGLGGGPSDTLCHRPHVFKISHLVTVPSVA